MNQSRPTLGSPRGEPRPAHVIAPKSSPWSKARADQFHGTQPFRKNFRRLAAPCDEEAGRRSYTPSPFRRHRLGANWSAVAPSPNPITSDANTRSAAFHKNSGLSSHENQTHLRKTSWLRVGEALRDFVGASLLATPSGREQARSHRSNQAKHGSRNRTQRE